MNCSVKRSFRFTLIGYLIIFSLLLYGRSNSKADNISAKENTVESIMNSKGFLPIKSAPRRIARIAEEKAHALGYELESMRRFVKKDRGGWLFYFSPKAPVFGGDLQVFVNRKGEVKEIRRGA